MQEIMRIGDKFVPADEDIKDVFATNTGIKDIAHKYKTDVLAVIGKGDAHNLTTQCNENGAGMAQEVVRLAMLTMSVADKYEMEAMELADIIKELLKGDIE